MNTFKTRPIRPWQEPKIWIKKHIFLSILIVLIGLLTLKGVVGAFNVGNLFSVKQIVISAVSDSIKTDENNHTNILLIGVGGEGHDGGDLTDTMIVASVDYKHNLIPMLSIPRDLYVENETVGWGSRINSVYEYVAENNNMDYNLGMQELIKEIENITEMEIDYYAKIDFTGFQDVIDALGGVEITLDENFSDPYYPAPDGSGRIYEPFYLPAGTQVLDGETALKYARSRHTTSDFDRAARQQEILNAIKDKATSLGFLINPSKIKNTLAAISANFETNLSFSEMMNFASLASNFGDDTIISAVLNDDPSTTGGIVYSPPQEEYGGAFVLVPYTNDFSEVQKLADLILKNPDIYKQQTPIQILNGTGQTGLAGLTALHLIRLGFNVTDASNAPSKDIQTSSMFFQTKADPETGTTIAPEKLDESTMEFIQNFIPVEISSETPQTHTQENLDADAKIIIVLGNDFMDFYNENPQYFYVGYYYEAPDSSSDASSSDGTADNETGTDSADTTITTDTTNNGN